MNKYLQCSLQLFADGDTGAAVQTAQGSEVSDLGESQLATDNGADENISSQNDAAVNKSEAFNQLVNGKYKTEANQWFKERFGKRIKAKDAKLQEYDEYRGKTSPVFEKLAVKYGLEDASDIDAIMQAVEQDNSYYEDYAISKGVSVEQAKTLIKAEKIAREQELREQQEIQQREFSQKYEQWMNQAQALKQKYPGFDFDYESTVSETAENFRRLLNSGVDVESAYTVIHRDEIMGGAMNYAYQSAQQELADKRNARTARPNENGVSQQQASTISDDWSKLSRQEKEKIRAAVSRGEKVNPHNFRDFLN